VVFSREETKVFIEWYSRRIDGGVNDLLDEPMLEQVYNKTKGQPVMLKSYLLAYLTTNKTKGFNLKGKQWRFIILNN